MEHRLIKSLHSPLHIDQIKQIHCLVVINYRKLIPLFTKKVLSLSFIDYARRIFDEIPQPDQRSWNSLISAYSKHSMNKSTIQTFLTMRLKGTQINCFTIPPLLKSVSSLLSADLGKQIHSLVMHTGLCSSSYVQAALVDFYAKIGDIDSAKSVFDGIKVKDSVCCNCLISGYSKAGNVVAARNLFDLMTDRTVVSWNSMLSCYAHNGDFVQGLKLFEEMQIQNCRANEYTVVTMLSMCAKLGNLEMGLRVKRYLDEYNFQTNMILSTALLEMYVKCGAVDEARREFDRMSKKDAVSWGTMIAGYTQNGRGNEAIELFKQMENKGIEPNDVTLVAVLSACAELGSVETGKRVANYVERRGLNPSLRLASALLGMYSKCGDMEKARCLFEKMPQKDIVAWNSMVMGLALNGFAEDAIAHYEMMKEIEIKPDNITFMGLLTACTHARLVDLGLEYFRKMTVEYGISSEVEHCACVVDHFCRCGKLKRAYDFILEMEIEPNSVIWGTLLSASRIHLNVEYAEIAANKLIERDPGDSGIYVLLANIYASAGRWKEASEIRWLMKSKRLQKTAAYSWIEMEDKVHTFLVGDTSHPQSKDVYDTLDGLAMHSTRTTHEFVPDL